MAPSPSTVLCLYRYDPLDRLASTQPAAQDNALRFYRKNRLATQIQGAIQHTFFGHDDQLLAQQQHSGKSTETSLLAIDQQGSVLHGVDGAGIESHAYNTYGHHPAESGLSCLMGFNGEQRDPVTGHYLLGNGYRACNPVLMRFNSPDELSPFGQGGLNAYAYCQGDPVNFRDVTGRMLSSLALTANVDDMLAAASRVHPVSGDMDNFLRNLAASGDAAPQVPSSSLVQASTSSVATHIDRTELLGTIGARAETSTSMVDARQALLQEIRPKTMAKRKLSNAQTRNANVKALARRMAASNKMPKFPQRHLESLQHYEKTLRKMAGHYRIPSNVPTINPNILEEYLDKIIQAQKNIDDYKHRIGMQQGQLTIRQA